MITGATRGIGKALATFFASKNGYSLILLSRSKIELDNLKKELLIKYLNTNISIYEGDISKAKEVEEIFSNCQNIDVLINNAAVAGPVNSIINIDYTDFKETIDINLLGSFNCTKEVIKQMQLKSYGKIINICGAGVGWDSTAINKTAYITSKYALYGFTESLSRELKEHNVDINCVSPGSFDTDLRKSLISQDKQAGTPQSLSNIDKTVGKLIHFLISPESDGISGKILSSIYDTPEKLLNSIEDIKKTSDYTIRKIDKTNYVRKIDE